MTWDVIRWERRAIDSRGRPARYYITRYDQESGPPKFAVEDEQRYALNRGGDFEYQPGPSSRDNDFIQRCRYDTFDAAAAALDHYLMPYQVRQLSYIDAHQLDAAGFEYLLERDLGITTTGAFDFFYVEELLQEIAGLLTGGNEDSHFLVSLQARLQDLPPKTVIRLDQSEEQK